MGAILILLLGVGFSYVGYGLLSLKRNPTAGVGFAGAGFLCRLAGPLLIVVVALLLPTLTEVLSLLVGAGFSYVGYGPLSLKRNPTAGAGFAAAGFLFRLAGPLLIIVALTVSLWRMP
jgi:hypothetical protein